MFKLLLVICLALLVLLSSSFSVALASEQTLMTANDLNSNGFNKYESLNPNSLAYPLKSMEERIKLSFIFDRNAKSRYLISLVNIRFRELVYIINFKKTGFLKETVGRYNGQIGKVKSNSENTTPDDKSNFFQNIKILEVLRDRYPANSSYWLSIQQAIDSTRGLE